jgi:hypothetical protein
VWEFDLSQVTPPVCAKPAGEQQTSGGDGHRAARSCTNAADFSFVRALERARPLTPFNP